MPKFRILTLSAICFLLVGGLGACVRGGKNTNTANVNVAGAITKPSPGLILSVSPAKGPAAGGTKVKITGENFTGTPSVLFGTVAAKDVQVVSKTEISAVSPAGTKGDSVDVTLRAPDAPTSTLVDGFHYE